jgi:hypothetical protein
MWGKLNERSGRIVLLLGTILTLASPAQAQVDSCYESLTQASQLYEAGKLGQVIATLDDCLHNRSLDRVTRRKMLNLATEAYIFMDSTQLARRTLLELLSLDPFFKVNEDIPEMRYLRQEVITFPAMELSTFFGPYLLSRAEFSSTELHPQAKFIDRRYSLKGVDGDYDVSWGFNTGIDVGLALHRYSNLDLHVGLNLSRYSFRYLLEMDNVPNFEMQPDRALLFVAEKHFWLSAPIYLSWNLIPRESIVDRHWVPYLKFGGTYDRLLQQSAKLSSLRLSFPPEEKFNLAPVERIGAYRQASNFSLLAGAGLKLHLHQSFLLFDLQYSRSLQNMRNTSQARYRNDAFYYVDQDFRLSNLCFRLGFGTFLFKAKIK